MSDSDSIDSLRRPFRGLLAGQAYSTIRDMILNLKIPPGYPLMEAELASQLGMSRTPVREALQRLRLEGLVTMVPRRGAFVSSLSPDDMQEIYEMLEGLEGMAVKLAAERADEAGLAALEEAVAAQETALAADDLDAWIVADERLHSLIIQLAGNRRIAEVVERVNNQVHRVRVFTLRLRAKPLQSLEEHRQTVEAIRRRDGNLAREITQRHRARAREELVAILRYYTIPPIHNA